MNHLAHLALAGDETPLLLGAILGDHVKGRLKGEFPAAIERGIHLHRAIDAYTDQHPLVGACLERLAPGFRRYGGIMLDVQFDYFLANNFEQYHEQSLASFSLHTLGKIAAHSDELTAPASQQVQRMHQRNSLAHHGTDAYLENALIHLSTRLKHDNPLAEAYAECRRLEPQVRRDFENFYPDLMSYVSDWKTQH